MTTATEKQSAALQSRYNFWTKKELEAIAADDADAMESASANKMKVVTEAQAAGVALLDEVDESAVQVATPKANGKGKKDTTPKSVKESAAVADKAKKIAAAKATATPTGATKAKTPRPKKEKVLQPCLDGCGEMVPGNFKMGHDAKLKSKILQIERGELDMNELPEIAQELVGFKKGELVTEKDAKGSVKSKTQTYIVTKAPVKFHGRPEITLTTR